MGKQMKAILETLKDSDRWGLTQTELIMKIKGLQQVEGKGNTIASSLAGEPVSTATYGLTMNAYLARKIAKDESVPVPDWAIKLIEEKERKRDYIKQADKLNASFSRSLKLLLNHGLISSGWIFEDGTGARKTRARYKLTEKGEKSLP